MNRQALEQHFEDVALELGVLSEAQQQAVSEAVRNHPHPAPAGGKIAMELGFIDVDVKIAILMAQSGERMLKALETAHAPENDPQAAQILEQYTDPVRYSRIGTVEREDNALLRTQQQWQQAEGYATQRRKPGVAATPQEDAAAREIILSRAEQSYRFAAAWLKVHAKEIGEQNPEQATAIQQAGAKLEISAQAIFLEARSRFQIPDEARSTAEQYEVSVAEYRQREKDKTAGKSWVNQTGRGGNPQPSGASPQGNAF